MALARSGSLGINIGLVDAAVDSPNHRGDDGRLLCRGMVSVLAGGKLQLLTASLTTSTGDDTAAAAAPGDMNGFAMGTDATGATSAVKFDSSCVTASTPPSSTCRITQISSTHNISM